MRSTNYIIGTAIKLIQKNLFQKLMISLCVILRGLINSLSRKRKLGNNMNLNQVAMGCKPDPTKFEITLIEYVNGNTIIMANYGGATFNGSKLMVLRGIHKDITVLDPHFLNEDHPVIARFIPTVEGLNLARIICTYIHG
jgi:hypothetical protein